MAQACLSLYIDLRFIPFNFHAILKKMAFALQGIEHRPYKQNPVLCALHRLFLCLSVTFFSPPLLFTAKRKKLSVVHIFNCVFVQPNIFSQNGKNK